MPDAYEVHHFKVSLKSIMRQQTTGEKQISLSLIVVLADFVSWSPVWIYPQKLCMKNSLRI